MRTFLITMLVALGIVLTGWAIETPAVTSLPQYHGRTRQSVESVLGKPLQTDTFPMTQAANEMRSRLFNTYPLSNPANAKVIIQESQWDDGNYWITLWFHQVNGQWIVLDSCRWRKDVLF
jgi:hypothetical protein